MKPENDLTISELLEMSKKLWELHKNTWSPMEPEYGSEFILYMIEEIGEAISIIKKKGEDDIMNSPEIRSHFIEEMTDVLMYFADALNRYHISSEEFCGIYQGKFQRNLKRNYEEEYREIN